MQIARDVLVDLVDCSGVDLVALEQLISEFIEEVIQIDSM